MDEVQAIQAAQQGDLAAFNRLVMAYQGIAYNVAYRIVGDTDAAADACQEAFLSAFKGIQRFRGGSFKSWILRIVTNACYDQLRYKGRRPADSLEDVAQNPDYSPKLVNGRERPEEHAMRQELSGVIQAGINSLPPDQRAVLVLSDVQGFAYQEIADITGISLGTVKSRLSRARTRLRDYLREHQELLPTQYRLTSSREQEI
ncbi:MAG: sigma-70 family RNA polymerase sigma factor [Anaerolineales bacterium]|nr:MAG: sigma-70 family RNA polymerase sigma factor [Anaerolineales bacterium]